MDFSQKTLMNSLICKQANLNIGIQHERTMSKLSFGTYFVMLVYDENKLRYGSSTMYTIVI